MNSKREVIDTAIMSEEFLLGAILVASSYGEKTAINEVRQMISPEYFTDHGSYHSTRSRIFKAMLDCEQAPHILNVANQLKKTNRLMPHDISELRRYLSLDCCSLEYISYAKTLKECAQELKPNLKQVCASRGIPL